MMQHYKNCYVWDNQGKPWDMALKGRTDHELAHELVCVYELYYMPRREIYRSKMWISVICGCPDITRAWKLFLVGGQNVQKLSSSNVYTSPQIHWKRCLLSFTLMGGLVFNNVSLESLLGRTKPAKLYFKQRKASVLTSCDMKMPPTQETGA